MIPNVTGYLVSFQEVDVSPSSDKQQHKHKKHVQVSQQSQRSDVHHDITETPTCSQAADVDGETSQINCELNNSRIKSEKSQTWTSTLFSYHQHHRSFCQTPCAFMFIVNCFENRASCVVSFHLLIVGEAVISVCVQPVRRPHGYLTNRLHVWTADSVCAANVQIQLVFIVILPTDIKIWSHWKKAEDNLK